MYKEEIQNGIISTAIGLTITFLVSIAIPTTNLPWAMTAVAFASFSAGFFSTHYQKKT